jgi:NAD-dependent histone deacetylase SIR2
LEVYPFAGIADAMPRHVPRLLLNRDRVGSFGNRAQDSIILGDIVQTIQQLADALGWGKELKELCEA